MLTTAYAELIPRIKRTWYATVNQGTLETVATNVRQPSFVSLLIMKSLPLLSGGLTLTIQYLIPLYLLDVCDGFLCYNGASCIIDQFGQAECDCPPGYEGVQCEISK